MGRPAIYWATGDLVKTLREVINLSGDPVPDAWPVSSLIQLMIPLVPEGPRSVAVEDASADIHSSPVTLWTVPAGERWRLKMVYKGATTSAAAIYASIGGVGAYAFNGATASQLQQVNDWLLAPGDSIGITQGGAGDTAIDCVALYERERIL